MTVAMTRQRATFRYEAWRAGATGIVETAASTFLILIALERFHAGQTVKALLLVGTNGGMLLTPLVVHWVRARGWRVATAAAHLIQAGAVGILFTALLPWLAVYVAGILLGTMCVAAAVPLITQMYQDNYPEASRGVLFSRTTVIRILSAAVFGFAAGALMDQHLRWYQALLGVYAAALFFASWCLRRCPSRPLTPAVDPNPFRAIHYIREDRAFRLTLLCWMFVGMANLIMVPLRVEYLANPVYGLDLKAVWVAAFTTTIPNVARLCMSPVWGRLFDRMDFFVMRILINVGIALGILAFFVGGTMVGLVIGSVLFGISIAGADLAWSLWVTKVARPERVAEYMSVHTFFTGVRGVIAPFLAFWLAGGVPLGWMGAGATVLVILGSAVLWPEVGSLKRRAQAREQEREAVEVCRIG